jgi:hypothetical protein
VKQLEDMTGEELLESICSTLTTEELENVYTWLDYQIRQAERKCQHKMHWSKMIANGLGVTMHAHHSVGNEIQRRDEEGGVS